jgi:hypothetical protein
MAHSSSIGIGIERLHQTAQPLSDSDIKVPSLSGSQRVNAKLKKF